MRIALEQNQCRGLAPRPLAAALLLGVTVLAHAAPTLISSRPLHASEMVGLQKYLKTLPEAATLDLTTLTAEHTGDHLAASIWSESQQPLPGLCRAELRSYVGRKRDWEPARQTSAVWQQAGPSCVRSDSAVMMSPGLSDRSALRLLRTGETLRERAAMLIGGTSGCRRTLYYDLRLSGVVTEGENAWRSGWQLTLIYVTREAEVRVGFRFTDGDLWPWKVTCPPP